MTDNNTSENGDTPAGSSREWNFHPKLPITLSPVFDSPPRPKAALRWIVGTWLTFSPPVNHLVFAIVAYVFFWPSASDIQTSGVSWMVQIFLVNLGATVVLGTALHLYLYRFNGQQQRLKFDKRPMEKSARFTFGDQVLDNLYWTLVWGVPVWSAWMMLYFGLAANGQLPVLETAGDEPVLFILIFFLIRFWQSAHFYGIHRLIHIPVLYKAIHHVHHRNINVGPWSGLSMHPIEHVLYFSSILIHFVVPSHPIHVIFHLFSLSLGALLSHSGFERVLLRDKETLKAGSFHHQLHHRYFECNYGSEEVPLDRWFHSFHDGTSAARQRIRAHKKVVRHDKHTG